jgi:hypothetical protein
LALISAANQKVEKRVLKRWLHHSVNFAVTGLEAD